MNEQYVCRVLGKTQAHAIFLKEYLGKRSGPLIVFVITSFLGDNEACCGEEEDNISCLRSCYVAPRRGVTSGNTHAHGGTAPNAILSSLTSGRGGRRVSALCARIPRELATWEQSQLLRKER